MSDDRYTGTRFVRVVADARAKIPFVGGWSIGMMTACLMLFSTIPMAILFHLPIPARWQFGSCFALLFFSGWLGSQQKEGVWLGTHRFYERFAGNLMPHAIVDGKARRAKVRVADVHSGTGAGIQDVVHRKRVRGTARTPFSWLRLYTEIPKASQVEAGLFHLDGCGYVGVIKFGATTAALGSIAYQQWCDNVLEDWIPSIKAPVQFLTTSTHSDRRDAELAFDRGVDHEAVGRDVQAGKRVASEVRRWLVASERDLAGDMAAWSLMLTHYLVVMPGAADKAGRPFASRIHASFGRRPATREEAERCLTAALRRAPMAGVRAEAAPAGEISGLINSSILGAQDAAATPDGTWFNNRWHRTVCLQGLGPEVATGLVVSGFTSTRAESVASVHYFPGDADTVRRRLRRRISGLEETLKRTGDNSESREALSQTRRLEKALINREVSCGNLAVSVTVSAVTREELASVVERLVAELSRGMNRTIVPSGPGFLPVLAGAPGGVPLGRAVFEVTSDFAPYLLPVMGTPFSDPELPLVGRHAITNAPLYWSSFAGDSFSMLIVGKPGAGKSVVVKEIVVREAMRCIKRNGEVFGTTVVVIDPKNEYESTMDLIGGRYVEMGRDSLNVFSLTLDLPPDEGAALVLPPLSVMAGDEYGGADDGRVITRLNAESSAVLEAALTQFLTTRGWSNAEPLLGDFIAFLRDAGIKRSAWEQDRCETFAARLSNYAQGLRGRAFNRPSTFNIADGTSIAIGLGEYASAYEGNLTAVFATIFTAARRAMRSMRGRLLVVGDEAHYCFEDKKAAGVLDDMIREGRAFGCGVILASQQPQDFMSGVGETLAGLAETKIILSLDKSVGDRAQSVFELSGEQLDVLTHNNEPGLAVLWTPTQNALIRVWPGADLLSSITTDAHGARYASNGAA